jgi:hypothetical protein
MSFAVVQNGAVRQMLQMDMPFTVGDKQYSSNFLRSSTPQEKLEAGVWEIIDGTRADDQFYWVSPAAPHVNEVNSTVEISYSATPKQLEDTTEGDVTAKGLKSQWVAKIKDTAKSLMSASDWMVIRKIERNVEITAEIAAYRTAVVAECVRLVAAINAAADVPALIVVLQAQSWPSQV